ncbi:hypothetical protein FA95DRAFT_115033 [Auriscalpium vulgare]|uniref:Uncharacterized protein n=1 Tax=Auriscalpium vulgare TaxID=40419 RepID=A0ACB8S7D0_9AGAM|nr:hypothetical protein FA95DRAFT_115033 [Auriscalpium vulgare]
MTRTLGAIPPAPIVTAYLPVSFCLLSMRLSRSDIMPSNLKCTIIHSLRWKTFRTFRDHQWRRPVAFLVSQHFNIDGAGC